MCHINNITVTYHSMVVVPTKETQSTCFWNVLHLFEDQSLWRHFSCDGNREWIHQSFLVGSVCNVRSYMVDLGLEVCLTGVVIYFSGSRLTTKCAVAKQLTSADNFHGEILGGIIIQ
jgi:hypothetical protein